MGYFPNIHIRYVIRPDLTPGIILSSRWNLFDYHILIQKTLFWKVIAEFSGGALFKDHVLLALSYAPV